ncbi:DivIVA domain-containing protein [candidate division KSB1 bacterium]|nr:DivIVA domain-containing protein [candidate division KSB1 bacterium]
MKLTPLDIRKQEFKRSMRGFDPEEVEAFLIMVADELELLIREKNQLNDEITKLRTQLKDYQQVEHTLRDTLMKATSTVEESRLNSMRESELRIHEAELKAEKIVEQAKEQLQELRSEINLLKAQKESFSRRLRHLLESQIELLDVLGMDDANLKLEEKKEESFTPRGRLPRMDTPNTEPEKTEPSPPHDMEAPSDGVDRTTEPKIVRGERKFDSPFEGMGTNPFDSDIAEKEDKAFPRKPDHSTGSLSDEIVE